MANFGHVEKITIWTEKGEITFRSKMEYRWYVWCRLRKEQGIIKDWWYEDPDSCLELQQEYMNNKKMYLPDFTILTDDNCYEFEETKGYFPPKDYTKIKLAADQYEAPITLIFARLKDGSKNAKIRAQFNRAKRLEKSWRDTDNRVIFEAEKYIFAPIKHLFEV